MRRVISAVVGPAEHGVVRHGLSLAGPVVLREPLQAATVVAAGDVVVAEFADRLWGPDTTASGVGWQAFAAAVHAAGASLVASLHDVPVAEDTSYLARRAALYRGVVAAADGVLTASDLDARRLAELGLHPPRLASLPLPVPVPEARIGSPSAPPESVTVLGFLYPGKGHEEVAAAMTAAPVAARWPLVCAGRVSDGHDDLLVDLRTRHAAVTVTGFVPDAGLAPLLQSATVPVAPNRVVGSSASIPTWWSHGRRPVVPDAPLTRELATRTPGSVLRYGPDGDVPDLPAALALAAGEPATTWLAAGVVPGPGIGETVDRRSAILRGWFG